MIVKYGVYLIDRLEQYGSNVMAETYEEALNLQAPTPEGGDSYIEREEAIDPSDARYREDED